MYLAHITPSVANVPISGTLAGKEPIYLTFTLFYFILWRGLTGDLQ